MNPGIALPLVRDGLEDDADIVLQIVVVTIRVIAGIVILRGHIAAEIHGRIFSAYVNYLVKLFLCQGYTFFLWKKLCGKKKCMISDLTSISANGRFKATPHKLQSFRLAEVYQHILWITSAVLPAKAH